MDQLIVIKGKHINNSTAVEVECNASGSVITKACLLLLQSLERENCPDDVWPHIQSAINCLSLIAKPSSLSQEEIYKRLAEAANG